MAAPCDNIDRANEFIDETCQNVEDSRQLFHQMCQDSNQLLQQPWPSKTANDDTNEEQMTDSDKKELVSGSTKSSGNEADNEEDDIVLSVEEARALAEVEDILSKAQEARKHQSKLTKTTKKKAKTHLTASQSSKQSTPQHSEETASADEKGQSNATTQSVASSDCSLTDTASDTAVISQSKLASLLSRTTAKTSRNATNRTQIDSKDRQNVSEKAAPVKLCSASRGTVKVPKPTSAAKMQYRTTSSEIGRYSVNSKRPPSGARKNTLQRQREQNTTGLHKAKQVLRQSKSVEGRSGEVKKLTRSSSEERRHKVASCQSVVKSAEWKVPHQYVQSRPMHGSDLSNAMIDVEQGMGRMRVQGFNSGVNGKVPLQRVESAPPFLLKTDGSSRLKVPVKLKKLQSSGEKLQDRLFSAALMSSNVTSSENHFKNRLDAKFSSPADSMSLGDLEMKLQQLHAECSQLCYVARELQKLAANITGICTWQEIHRTKSMLQTITVRYNELQQEIQQLRKVEKSLLSQSNRKPPRAHHPTHKRSLSLPLPSSSWIPAIPGKKASSRLVSPTSDGAEGASSGCSSIQPSSTGSSSVMHYKSVKDLRRLKALQYKAQFVMWQMDLEKLIADDILPLLKDLDPADEDCLRLYRTIYGLLCHSAEAYPSLIRDNIGDSDEENEDGDHG